MCHSNQGQQNLETTVLSCWGNTKGAKTWGLNSSEKPTTEGQAQTTAQGEKGANQHGKDPSHGRGLGQCRSGGSSSPGHSLKQTPEAEPGQTVPVDAEQKGHNSTPKMDASFYSISIPSQKMQQL